MFNFNILFGPDSAAGRSLPSSLVAPEFGEVSVREVGDRLQVVATIAMGAFLLGDGEKCMAGLALDASQSMKDDYGRGKTIPPDVSQRFIEQGKFEDRKVDGVVRRVLSKEARQEALKNGWAIRTPNIVHEPCSKMIDNLIRTFATGGVTSGNCEVIYWACDADGIESIGEIQHAQLSTVTLEGPKGKKFGPRTNLTPPFKYFAQKAANTNGVLVFVTDGHIEDEASIVAETHRVAAEIHAGTRPSLKCVLLGIGRQVDRPQLDRIDDMEMPAGLEEIDIWNAKVLGEMRDMNDAWSEIFDPDTVVGTSIRVFNDKQELVHEATDEVKALITFEMPAGSSAFDLVLDGEMKVHQPLA